MIKSTKYHIIPTQEFRDVHQFQQFLKDINYASRMKPDRSLVRYEFIFNNYFFKHAFSDNNYMYVPSSTEYAYHTIEITFNTLQRISEPVVINMISDFVRSSVSEIARKQLDYDMALGNLLRQLIHPTDASLYAQYELILYRILQLNGNLLPFPDVPCIDVDLVLTRILSNKPNMSYV